jgi:hypothetical protein
MRFSEQRCICSRKGSQAATDAIEAVKEHGLNTFKDFTKLVRYNMDEGCVRAVVTGVPPLHSGHSMMEQLDKVTRKCWKIQNKYKLRLLNRATNPLYDVLNLTIPKLFTNPSSVNYKKNLPGHVICLV